MLITYNLMTGISNLVHIHNLSGVSTVIHECLHHSKIILQTKEYVYVPSLRETGGQFLLYLPLIVKSEEPVEL
jgi:hypothetical protein